jgi:N-methylhydantoinase A/oxoprolinase/acetone carboxylase beta subunit
VVRIGAPLTVAVPPLAGWPAELRAAVSAGAAVVVGGAEYDGRPQAPLDRDAVARFLATVADRADAVAVTGVFSAVAPDHELAVLEIARRELGGGVRVSLSHEIGTLGLVERENATVLNAALAGSAEALAAALRRGLEAEGMEAEAFLTQNDGTLMVLEHALRFPVLMIGSGPANSMRGAAYLSGMADAVVVDVGGTSTEVGALVNGFPREAPRSEIGGVRTAFRMPDIHSLALGGGTVLDLDADPPRIGPRSVGSALGERALAFGGETPTLTDAAVAAGRARIGSHDVPPERRAPLARALAVAGGLLEDAIDRAGATAGAPPPVVVVGGASMLVPDEPLGGREVIRPPDRDVANAIGAAIAHVSGTADRICANRPDALREALEEARAAAFASAVHAGADPAGVQVVETEEIPLTYLLDPAVRIRVRAVGPRS